MNEARKYSNLVKGQTRSKKMTKKGNQNHYSWSKSMKKIIIVVHSFWTISDFHSHVFEFDYSKTLG